MKTVWIFITFIVRAVLVEGGTTAAPATCENTPTACGANSYCFEAAGQLACKACDNACDGCNGAGNTNCKVCKPDYTDVNGACLACDISCDGCDGSGNSNCKACKIGYKDTNGACLACTNNTFGMNCTGTCHCQKGEKSCDKEKGYCTDFLCALGWTGAPECQQACSNNTYGYDCAFKCHCPPLDPCSPINGLCRSGSCREGYSGAGCQNYLPQLSSPPDIVNVTCANVTVTWLKWTKNVDRGNIEAVIAQYELYSMHQRLGGNESAWKRELILPHVADQASYQTTLTDLIPDALYRFRVDVRQQSGDKLEKSITQGKPSVDVIIPCTTPTTTVSTTPVPGTTSRPPGPHLLDATKFIVEFLDEETMMVQWAVYPNTSNYVLNVSLTYYEHKIQECSENASPNITTVDVPEDGNYNITGLLPWRQYFINISATIEEHGIIDYLLRNIDTPEHVPTGKITNIMITLKKNNGGLVTWSQLPCYERGGVLLYYQVDVYKMLKPRELALNVTTNETSSTLQTLQPYTEYGVSVVYVNSEGSGPEPTNLTIFQTEQDVPGPPNITEVISSQTTLTVYMTRPEVANGILLKHRVSVSQDEGFTDSLSKSQDVALGTNITITNLSPDTLYYIKARTSTVVGYGSYSTTVTFATKPSTPPPPTGGSGISEDRNETCVGITWNAPNVIADTIVGYNISYQKAGTDQQSFMATNKTTALVCDLDPGSYYEFQVFAANNVGYGPPHEIRISTEQSDPPTPPAPEVLNTTATSIAVALDPIAVMSSTLTYGYLLFVDEVQARTVRAVSTSNTTCLGENELPGNIVKNFTQAEIPSRTHFIIGNGKSYGAYNNTVLKENHLYDIYYVIISYFEGICKYSYVKTIEPVKAMTPPPVVVPTDDSDSTNTGLIIAIVVIVLVIIIVIIVVIIICLIRRSREQRYAPYFNEKDEYDLKVYTVLDDYDPHKWWNTIYSLRESRYIIAGREYLPDSKVITGNTGMVGKGSPISFQDEFASLPHGRQATISAATERDNELKNRFSHLLPYDHSRVLLDPDENDDGDYINASFIKGYKHQRAYIAAQSPFEEDTVLDFWRMIYQYEVSVIVMMSNLVEDNIVKCTQYWPNSGRVLYGHFILDLIDEQEYADYTIRTVHLRTKLDTDWQVVRIFELTYWPEHGVPDDTIPLLEMRHKVNVYHTGHSSPIVVHCGTGVSRTGVYIAIDSLLEQYEAEGRISVLSFVRKMRKDRPAMVRTAKQYTFIYEAIFEAMVAGDTRLGHEEFKERYQTLTEKNPNSGHSYLHCQFKSAQEFTRKLFPSRCSNALVPANVNKNRFCEIVPPDSYRPILITPGGMGRTDYINAVFLDSHRQQNHYLITQTPLHTTVIDFWKLVYDHDVHTIVMMEPMTYGDDTSAEYWPEDNMKQYEPFFVETTDVYQQENITIRNLKIVCMQDPKNPHMVRQLQFNAWSDSEFIPKSKSMLLDVVDLVNSWQISASNNTTPILVHCKDGATHSGLFVAVSILCEKVLDEGEVDIYHTVKHLKRRRNQIVDMLDQYRFCHKALWDFINMRMPNGTLTSQMSRTQSDIPYKSLSLTSYGSKHEYMPY